MKTAFFAYSHALREPDDISAALKNDYIVATAGEHRHLGMAGNTWRLLVEPKLLRYMDVWGASYYKQVDSPGAWFPGPGDRRTPRFDEGAAFPYKRDEFYLGSMWRDCADLMAGHPEQAGIFADDFRPEVDYWDLSQATRAACRFEHPEREAYRLRQLETAVRAQAAIEGQIVVVNGTGHPKQTEGPRLHESIGKWSRLDSPLIRKGDWLLVKGIDNEGGWAVTDPAREQSGGYPGGTSFLDVFRDVLDFAEQKDLVVALCCAKKDEGKSQCRAHPYMDPKTWESL